MRYVLSFLLLCILFQNIITTKDYVKRMARASLTLRNIVKNKRKLQEGKTVDVHSKSVILFTPEIHNIEDYLKLELGDFFHVHRYVNLEMAKLRDKEQKNDSIEN